MNPALPSDTPMDDPIIPMPSDSMPDKFKILGELVAADQTLSETDKDILFKKIYSNLSSTIANGGKTRGINTYYKEEYALQLVPHLDYLLDPTTPPNAALEFSLDDYPNWNSLTTLKLFVCNAFRFVVEQCDPDGKYMELRLRCRICKTKDGVKIIQTTPRVDRFKLEIKARRTVVTPEQTEILVAKKEQWELDLEEFMRTATTAGAMFKRPDESHPDRISLTQEQINKWSRVFDNSDVFGGVIKRNEILARRIIA